MKRFLVRTAAALLAAVLFLPQTARAVSARSAIVLDAVTGRVLYEKDASAGDPLGSQKRKEIGDIVSAIGRSAFEKIGL